MIIFPQRKADDDLSLIAHARGNGRSTWPAVCDGRYQQCKKTAKAKNTTSSSIKVNADFAEGFFIALAT